MSQDGLQAKMFRDARKVLELRKGFKTTVSWRELVQAPATEIGRIVGAIAGSVDEFVTISGLGDVAVRGGPRGQFRKITSAEKPRRLAREDVLERVLVLGDRHLYNRFNFLSGLTKKEFDPQTRGMTVDIVRSENRRTVVEIIELKNGTSADHPIAAMSEAIMYYLLYGKARATDVHLPPLADKLDLSVVAPKAYYAKWLTRSMDKNKLRVIAESLSTSLREGPNIARPTLRFKVTDIVPFE